MEPEDEEFSNLCLHEANQYNEPPPPPSKVVEIADEENLSTYTQVLNHVEENRLAMQFPLSLR